MSEHPTPSAVFTRQGEAWQPSALARGPWDPRAQHGGAPCALFVHVAEEAMPEPGWQLARLTVELIRPVPVAPLRTECSAFPARSTTRMSIDLFQGEHPGRARPCADAAPAGAALAGRHARLDARSACCRCRPTARERLHIPGLPQGISFYGTAVETRNAQGDPSKPGAGAAWFRLQVPVVEGRPTSPAMRAVAAADFGNGLSWVLPAERYLFTNADLSLHLHRQPIGEWIGLMSQTQMDGSGAGTALSRLFDEQGGFGVAVQTLALRER